MLVEAEKEKVGGEMGEENGEMMMACLSQSDYVKTAFFR